MSATPFYICVGLLIALSLVQLGILIAREIHHSRIEAGLIDKILEQHGLNAIPHEHPLAELVQRVERKAEGPDPVRVDIPIPGMAAFKHSYNRVMKGQEPAKK